jgi:tartrate-resistant acid phosphatase type 5
LVTRIDAPRRRGRLRVFLKGIASVAAALLALVGLLLVAALIALRWREKEVVETPPGLAPWVVALPAPAGSASGGLAAAAGSTMAAGRAPVVRFAAMGDTGKGNRGQALVASALEAKCAASGCDFVLLLGDNIYESGPSSDEDALFEQRFERPYCGLSVPFYAALGNHDCGGNGVGFDIERSRHEIAYTRRSSKWRMPARYYAVSYPGVDLVAVDTNAQMFGRDEAQRRAVAGWLRGSKATWKLVFGHHPYLSNGTHGNAGAYERLPSLVPVARGEGVKDFLEETVCGEADLYLSAHDHSRQWLTETCRGTELVVSGAGATTTSLPGGNSARFQAISRGFVYIRVEGATLTAEFVDDTGETDFVRQLTRPAAE